MSEPARRQFSFREYVRLEEYSNVRHEFLDGVIYAMAGGTPAHAALAARVIQRLGARLAGGPCEVFTSDLRVRVAATGLATYPDVTIVCGPLETDPEDPATVLNPTVLVEVLSDSAAEYDRGEKLDHYRKVDSLREVVWCHTGSPRWRCGDVTSPAPGRGPRCAPARQCDYRRLRASSRSTTCIATCLLPSGTRRRGERRGAQGLRHPRRHPRRPRARPAARVDVKCTQLKPPRQRSLNVLRVRAGQASRCD